MLKLKSIVHNEIEETRKKPNGKRIEEKKKEKRTKNLLISHFHSIISQRFFVVVVGVTGKHNKLRLLPNTHTMSHSN